MRFPNKPVVFFTVMLLCLVAVNSASAITVPDRPNRYVVDLAGIIDDNSETKLNGFLQELEQKTTAQFVVLTIESLEGESIEDFSLALAHDKWKLGQKGKDNGLLLLISIKDRKYRVEVGYGLEGVLPDSLVGSIGRDLLVPFFKKGDYSNGVYAAALALTNTIAKDAGIEITGMPKLKRFRQGRRASSPLRTVMSLVVFIFLLILFLRNPRAFLLFFLFSSMGGGRSWGSGGGFGGGFGSFGGGGGGGFGGGGSSGGW